MEQANIVAQNRWRSPALWSSIAGLIVVVFQVFDLYSAVGLTEVALQNVITAIGALLTAFGIINNPTSANKF